MDQQSQKDRMQIVSSTTRSTPYKRYTVNPAVLPLAGGVVLFSKNTPVILVSRGDLLYFDMLLRQAEVDDNDNAPPNNPKKTPNTDSR